LASTSRCDAALDAVCKENLTMLRYALGLGVVFLVIALIAGLFGFVGVASYSWAGAQVLFFVFLVLAVLAFVRGYVLRDRRSFRAKEPVRSLLAFSMTGLIGRLRPRRSAKAVRANGCGEGISYGPSARKDGASSHHPSSPSATDLECDERGFFDLSGGPKMHRSALMHTPRPEPATLAQSGPTGPTTTTQTAVASGDKDHNAQSVSKEVIRLCAYRKWESAGMPAGHSIQFWLEAEHELVQGK
jgi:uncharacterized membrane protein YtjA (UPF0391 family)